jgi:hypothetical protein
MGWMPKDDEPIQLNGAFYIGTNIMRFVVALAAEGKLGALYHNCQKGIMYHKFLKDTWGILNPKHLCIAIMQLLWRLQTTLLHASIIV